jgi:hypothetical protein
MTNLRMNIKAIFKGCMNYCLVQVSKAVKRTAPKMDCPAILEVWRGLV